MFTVTGNPVKPVQNINRHCIQSCQPSLLPVTYRLRSAEMEGCLFCDYSERDLIVTFRLRSAEMEGCLICDYSEWDVIVTSRLRSAERAPILRLFRMGTNSDF
jgi:hypothetical protein